MSNLKQRKAINIGLKFERPTIEQVLKTKGFEHWTAKQAEAYLKALEQFCRCICRAYLKNTNNDNER